MVEVMGTESRPRAPRRLGTCGQHNGGGYPTEAVSLWGHDPVVRVPRGPGGHRGRSPATDARGVRPLLAGAPARHGHLPAGEGGGPGLQPPARTARERTRWATAVPACDTCGPTRATGIPPGAGHRRRDRGDCVPAPEASPCGRGAGGHVRRAGTLPPPEPGLRSTARHHGNLDPADHDASHVAPSSMTFGTQALNHQPRLVRFHYVLDRACWASVTNEAGSCRGCCGGIWAVVTPTQLNKTQRAGMVRRRAGSKPLVSDLQTQVDAQRREGDLGHGQRDND